ncbi:MAG: CotS family spore coat protein [Lachnospiraceae bacterium]|nr:CotS family spore coat protein [Lachnospiraceae bacterium]
MEEKSLEFFEKYEITVIGTARTRGAFRIDTEQGPKLLMPYSGSENRAVFEQALLQHLKTQGFLVDGYVPNKEGNYVTQDEYGDSFLLKDWYFGDECNVRKPEQALMAVKHLAALHNALSGVALSVDELSGAVQKTLPELFEKRNRELRRVRSFIREKRRKAYFETIYINTFSEFYEKAETALERANENGCGEILEASVKAGCACHGTYTHHNLLVQYDGTFATVNFDKACLGVQIADFYLFFRKLMEKTGWNRQLAGDMISAYASVRRVDRAEWQVFYLLLSYPEKFWKITNCYHNGKKSWIPQKTTEKLLAVIEQEKEKEALLADVVAGWCR